jgi:dTDP-glucose 4,6-dehydratase
MTLGNILVTGGAGFIGSNFLNMWVPRQPTRLFVNADKLTYAANLSNLRGLQGRDNYRLERIDIGDREQVEGVFRRYRPELIVHFAAESHVDRSILEPDAFIRTNIVGTFNLLEAFRRLCAEQPDALFHHVSTDEVYGSLGAVGQFTESSPYDPSSPYSASKASSDLLVRAYARTYGLPVKITNCSNNYGPYQFPEKLIPLVILNAFERKPLPVYGQGLNVRDWLHVDDHCEAIWAVIERGKIGATYNIGGHSEQRNIDVVEQICTLVAEETGAAASELLGLITYVRDRPGHDLRYAIDASKVTRECGFSPKETFDSGLRRTVRWYLENRAWVDEVRTGEYRRFMSANYDDRG